MRKHGSPSSLIYGEEEIYALFSALCLDVCRYCPYFCFLFQSAATIPDVAAQTKPSGLEKHRVI